jgi:hypothetical protein
MRGAGTIKNRRSPSGTSRVAPKEVAVMLTLKDCLELSELSQDEVNVIAEHEHIPEIVACELGSELLHSNDGVSQIKAYMLDCVEHARRAGDLARAESLYAIYRRFDASHPTPKAN